MTISPQLISGVAGAVLSLAFSYIPGLRKWFAPKESATKSFIMLLCLLLVTVAAFVIRCNSFEAACFINNWVDYATAFGAALALNQSVYAISPQVSTAQ